MSETKRYRVVGTDLCHNGETIREGRLVDLTDQDAADLQQFLVEVPVPVEPVVTQQTGDAGAGDQAADQTGDAGAGDQAADQTGDAGAGDQTANQIDKAPEAKSTTKKGAAK